jgi:hypothetical protein
MPPAPPGGPLAEKPTLLNQLPITAFVFTAIFAGGGAVSYELGGKAVNELKVPADHTTPLRTHSLVVQARAGQVVSYVLFPVTGITTLVSTINTIRAVRKIAKLATMLPQVGLSAVPLPGGTAVGVLGGF